ncbi:MAG: hypothetical protein GY862_02795 [Gammaproteobacteria bacterium]|nr:hypothetical protein [Gammaproteobacteria bacterium]
MDDYLILESLLLERLKAELTRVMPDVHVLTAADLAGVEMADQPVPAVHVLLGSDNPSGDDTTEKEQHIEQCRYVILVVRNVRTLQSGAAARSEAGPFIACVLRVLQGWEPKFSGMDFTPLQRVRSPLKPAYVYGTGHMRYPLLFRTEFYFNA